ncbi:MAG: hypothetical protein QW331_01940 [Candidatus Woesearchaeota archaeon]
MRLPIIEKHDPLKCARNLCPICMRKQAIGRVKQLIERESFFGNSPAPFVGRFNYPNIYVGILSNEEKDNWVYDAPRYWAANNFSIGDVVNLRSSLVNARFQTNILQRTKLLEISKEIGMAEKPVEVEINLKEKPTFNITFSSFAAPLGPVAKLKDAGITSNAKISTKVEKVVDDNYMKAQEAINYLYKHGFDENFLSRLLSVGNVGVNMQRRLVPTRWSLIAVQDILGKDLSEEIKNYQSVNEYLLFYRSYLGNHYFILLLPDVWSYELFETHVNVKDEKGFLRYSTDYESYFGRKNYAENCAGGYYTVRLAALEWLKQQKKQASCFVFRIIDESYTVPLGSWVTLEAARKALLSKPIAFSTREAALYYLKHHIQVKFGQKIDNIFKDSKILSSIKQKKLIEWH